jgi:hypothetical protein
MIPVLFIRQCWDAVAGVSDDSQFGIFLKTDRPEAASDAAE